MSISDITLNDSITTSAVYGGNELHFVKDGTQVANGIHLSDLNCATFMDRIQMTIKSRPTVLNVKTGGLSKAKQSVSIARPYRETDYSSVMFNSIRLDLECHPNAPGDNTKLRYLLAQFIVSGAADALFLRGDIS